MKLAWICYNYTYTRRPGCIRGSYVKKIVEILFYEPDSDDYDEVVPIVYEEIVKS